MVSTSIQEALCYEDSGQHRIRYRKRVGERRGEEVVDGHGFPYCPPAIITDHITVTSTAASGQTNEQTMRHGVPWRG